VDTQYFFSESQRFGPIKQRRIPSLLHEIISMFTSNNKPFAGHAIQVGRPASTLPAPHIYTGYVAKCKANLDAIHE
jgi:hypothetical protein